MSAFFIDLDDTLLYHKTFSFVPGALEKLKEIKEKGHQIFITTRRGDDWNYPHVYSRKSTQDFLDSLGIKFDGIIFNCESPRVIINDQGVFAIQHPPASPFDYNIDYDPNPIKAKNE